ncbi:MAG: hypothetical protein ACREBE_27535, partial [bacterium]
MRIGPAAVAFGGPTAAVIIISAVVTLRAARGDAPPLAQPVRFSGSTVVQRLPSLLASPKLTDDVQVVVVRDESAVAFYNSPGEYEVIVDAWREA